MTSDKGVVERLRERAASERAIQINNEAVAKALAGEIEAFDRRDGTHNTYAVRLCLDHQNAAKRDAALAADWDEAADRIKALERALTDLVNKLDAIDKPVANVFVFAGAHGYHYAGPNYADELSAARAALSPSTPGSDNAG